MNRQGMVAQLRAARNSVEAAAIALDTCLEALGSTAATPPGPGEPGQLSAWECDHNGAEDASAMGMPPRALCKKCQCFVYLDGRTVPISGLDEETADG